MDSKVSLYIIEGRSSICVPTVFPRVPATYRINFEEDWENVAMIFNDHIKTI